MKPDRKRFVEGIGRICAGMILGYLLFLWPLWVTIQIVVEFHECAVNRDFEANGDHIMARVIDKTSSSGYRTVNHALEIEYEGPGAHAAYGTSGSNPIKVWGVDYSRWKDICVGDLIPVLVLDDAVRLANEPTRVTLWVWVGYVPTILCGFVLVRHLRKRGWRFKTLPLLTPRVDNA